MDTLTTSILFKAVANPMYTTTFLVGVTTLGAGLLSVACHAFSERVSGLGQALMMIGAGLAGPSLIQILFKLGDLNPDEIPVWLPFVTNALFPFVACDFGFYSLYRLYSASRSTDTALR